MNITLTFFFIFFLHRGSGALQNGQQRAYKGDSSPTYPHESPINYSVESLATSSRPQRSCARFSFCYIENFSDDDNTQG